MVINKAAESNNNNGIDAMFLLKAGESLDIKIDYFIKSLKPLLSRHRIVKSIASLKRKIKIIPKELQSHLVYKFSCGNCNVTYYVKTERYLNVRSSEHIGI